MQQSIKNLKKAYIEKGFFIIKNFFSKSNVCALKDEIKVAINIDKYFDENGIIRRIERLYDKGGKLTEINNKIIDQLNNIFGEPYVIFKDKFNAKPPGGDGFFAHYDGIFMFKDEKGVARKGWYEYADNFVNVLVALDPCNQENGTIEIAKVHNGSFENLLLNTKQNGTPEILDKIKKEINFYTIELNPGDIVIFNNQCPHKSEKNNSKQSRETLYYTYNQKKYGSFYERYFNDKKNSKNNKSKSLSK
jgi:ectoine hydroxylase-related dioxygenase (phytanoyl-CoA dioxygenase family)